MRKIKVLMAALVLLCSSSLFAKDFDWSECWCNYGAGIEKGDMLLSVDASLPWTYFDVWNSGGWAIPTIMADFEIAQPIWKLPFSFGGYFGLGLNNYHYAVGNYTHGLIYTGGSATYHMQMPVENLDLYSGIKTGVLIDFSKYYSNGAHFAFDFGFNMGASWFFSEGFGVNLELGYPMCKAGVVFKF